MTTRRDLIIGGVATTLAAAVRPARAGARIVDPPGHATGTEVAPSHPLVIADTYTVIRRARLPAAPVDVLLLPAPVQSETYVAQVRVEGGTPPYRYAIVTATGANAWLLDRDTGALTGTPTHSEADLITVQVEDAAARTVTAAFVLTVLTEGVGSGNWPASLRPAAFGELPAHISSSTIGRRAPNDTSGSGQRFVKPNSNYSNVIYITSRDAPDGRYTCATPDTHYILKTDLVSDTWCISITADRILLDLNGHTLTYLNADVRPTSDTAVDAAGIFATGYNLSLSSVEVINGRIQTGAGAIVGTLPGDWGCYGYGANPFRTEQISGTPRFQLRGLYFKWNAYSSSGVAGHNTSYEFGLIEFCTFEDYGASIVNRELNVWGTDTHAWGTIRNCRFISMRQGAIGNALVAHDNEIWVDGWCTNSMGILVARSGQKIHNNNVYVTGCHPQAMFLTGARDASVTDNWLEAMYTRVGNQVPSKTNGIDDAENYADALTWRYGSDNGVDFRGNTLLSHARSATVRHPMTRATLNSTARGFWYAKLSNSVNSNNRFSGNCVMAASADEVANCWALAMGGPATGLIASGNHFITNRNMFYMADGYNYYQGLTGNPVLTGNIFELFGEMKNTTAITNGAGATFGVPLTSCSVDGTTVTVTFPSQGGAVYAAGAKVTISGIAGGTGYNGTFTVDSCTTVLGGVTTLSYRANVSGAPQIAGATIGVPVVVEATFRSNRWRGGIWRGPTEPSSLALTNAAGPSGSIPVTYVGFTSGTSIRFVDEPAGRD